ncbi:MAG: asparagine synthase (glutamine-hydrolyzing) [Halanaerobiales bacterium]
MCGITGWIDFDRDLKNKVKTIKNMSETLKHRGPDESGIFSARHILLGHRRLTVVDPAGGQQPMSRVVKGNRYTIVYNGELYNTEELRQDLLEAGYSFDSYSDTEVLLTSYIHYGSECVEYLNGIFAFAIWNERKEEVFLARDRVGVKPLFFYRRNKSLIFGSEIKALLDHPLVEPILDQEGMMELFGLGPARCPGSGLIKDIEELKPGYCLTFNRKDSSYRQYWQLKSYYHQDDFLTTVKKVRELVDDSVRRQLISDVPLCTFLSGGLDSSAIAAIAAREYQKWGKRLTTYSVNYQNNDLYFEKDKYQPNSDSKWIPEVVKKINSKHHEVVIKTEDLVNSLREAVIANDLPGMADIDSSLYLFTRDIKKQFTVALSGECADEIFGGYPWFRREEDLNSATFPWSNSLDMRRGIMAEDFKNLPLQSYVDAQYRKTVQEVPVLPEESEREKKIKKLFYLNLKWFMVTLLTRKDRMSMANSLEVRVPFADHRLIEYCWNIPWQMKNYNQMEKGLLRETLRGIVPEQIRKRRKSPYPKIHNPDYTILIKEWLKIIIDDPTSPLLQLVDKEKALELVKGKYDDLSTPWFGQLMRGAQLMAYLIQLNIWLEEYKIRIIP